MNQSGTTNTYDSAPEKAPDKEPQVIRLIGNKSCADIFDMVSLVRGPDCAGVEA
jgi:hypothetical protein